MKAYVLRGNHGICLEETEIPSPAKGEVLVKVHAAGVCDSDIVQIYSGESFDRPLIPGHRFSGEVEALGQNVDAKWLHRKVGISPILPCRVCPPCCKGHFELCTHYECLGFERNGGFAEYAVAPASNLLSLPENVSYEEAAMMEPMAIAVHAMRKAFPKPGHRAVVCGTDVIGTLLLMFLKESGIKEIFAIGQGEEQKQIVEKAGFSMGNYYDSRHGDMVKWVREHTGGDGADVLYECTGRNGVLSQMIEMAAPMGRICLVGKPGTHVELEKNACEKMQKDQLVLSGSWNASFTGEEDDDWHYALDRISRGRVSVSRLISHRYSIETFTKAFQLTQAESGNCMKVMINVF